MILPLAMLYFFRFLFSFYTEKKSSVQNVREHNNKHSKLTVKVSWLIYTGLHCLYYGSSINNVMYFECLFDPPLPPCYMSIFSRTSRPFKTVILSYLWHIFIVLLDNQHFLLKQIRCNQGWFLVNQCNLRVILLRVNKPQHATPPPHWREFDF